MAQVGNGIVVRSELVWAPGPRPGLGWKENGAH